MTWPPKRSSSEDQRVEDAIEVRRQHLGATLRAESSASASVSGVKPETSPNSAAPWTVRGTRRPSRACWRSLAMWASAPSKRDLARLIHCICSAVHVFLVALARRNVPLHRLPEASGAHRPPPPPSADRRQVSRGRGGVPPEEPPRICCFASSRHTWAQRGARQLAATGRTARGAPPAPTGCPAAPAVPAAPVRDRTLR